jgi:hypothetical protein
VLALEAGAALVLLAAIDSAPTPAGVTTPTVGVDAVAAEPASYRSQTLRVRGRIVQRPTRVSARDRRAFVLDGARGGRLLVVPADEVRWPTFKVGTAVAVHGTIVIPPDSRRLTRRPSSRTAIAQRIGAPALIKATEVRLSQ